MPARWKDDRPMSRQAFDERFPDEEACARYLAERRWLDGFVCLACWPRKGLGAEAPARDVGVFRLR